MPHVAPYADQRKPNVIWFMVDQMRAQAMSLARDPNLHTPNLDRMARDGTWFDQAISGFPLCCPARGSFITGVYPHRCVPGHEYPLPTGMPTVADAFNRAGYHTAWFGKWHLDGAREGQGRAAFHLVKPEHRGSFATWLGYENNNAPWDCWVHGHDHDGEKAHARLPGHETDELTSLLLAEVERCRNRPFFACVSVQPPHDPFTAPSAWMAHHNPANIRLRPNVPPIPEIQELAQKDLAGYYGLIEHIDHNVGRLLAKLEELGLDDNTYVVFCSDHGDHQGSHGLMRKTTPYDESVRVPFMVWGGRRWARARQGRMCDAVVNHVDLAPTSLGLAGIPVPPGMEGHNYAPIVQAHGADYQAALAAMPQEAYMQCVVPTMHGGSDDLPWRGIVTRDGWKYVAIEGQPHMLFDRRRDPYELVNLAFRAEAKQRRHELNSRLQAWIERTGDSFRLPAFNENGQPVQTLAARTTWPQPPAR